MDWIEATNAIPKISLGCFPTPVCRLQNLEKRKGVSPLYVKRDDLNGLGPGGNKTRSLEYVIADALHMGCDTVIASGPVQSNLCTLAAAACARIGLACVLVLNGSVDSPVTGNLLLNKLLDVQTHRIGAVSSEERSRFVDAMADSLRREGKKPYVIKNGASTGLGALGYVGIVEELLDARRAGLPIRDLFVPGGNGGVAAGVIYGNKIFGMPFHVRVISVEFEGAELTARIGEIIGETEALTGIRLGERPEDICDINDAYRGGGWGADTEESKRLIKALPKTEGIFIEHVYNAKTLVGMLDYIEKGRAGEGSCFIHTGGFGSLFAQFG